MTGVCPSHPERPVEGTCPRCGSFVCADCAQPACASCLERDRLARGREEAERKNRELVREAVACGVLTAVFGVMVAGQIQRHVHLSSVTLLVVVAAFGVAPFLGAAALFSSGDPQLARAGVALELVPAVVLFVLAPGMCTFFVFGAPARARSLLKHIEALRAGQPSDDPYEARLAARVKRRLGR